MRAESAVGVRCWRRPYCSAQATGKPKVKPRTGELLGTTIFGMRVSNWWRDGDQQAIRPFSKPVLPQNKIGALLGRNCGRRRSQSDSPINSSSDRSTSIEWCWKSNQWQKTSKLRSVGQVLSSVNQPASCTMKISSHSRRLRGRPLPGYTPGSGRSSVPELSHVA